MRGALDSLFLSGDGQTNWYAQKHTLGPPTLLGGERTSEAGLDGINSRAADVRRSWFHRSSPQKSISGEISSMPYSHPSGRGFPRQTTTAALLAPVARLVRDKRCSRSSASLKITMQP